MTAHTYLKKESWIQKSYNKILNTADSPQAFKTVCLISFAESSFFPLPPDLMLIPMIIANRALAWSLAFWCTLTSVLGGFLGYLIGYYFFLTFGQWIIQTYGLEQAMIVFQQSFAHYGFWVIVAKGLTPIPYKLVTIASGMAHFNIFEFTVASIIARGFRFYLLSALLWKFGPWARLWIEKYLTLFLTISLTIIVMGFFIIKYIYR